MRALLFQPNCCQDRCAPLRAPLEKIKEHIRKAGRSKAGYVMNMGEWMVNRLGNNRWKGLVLLLWLLELGVVHRGGVVRAILGIAEQRLCIVETRDGKALLLVLFVDGALLQALLAKLALLTRGCLGILVH